MNKFLSILLIAAGLGWSVTTFGDAKDECYKSCQKQRSECLAATAGDEDGQKICTRGYNECMRACVGLK